MTTYAPIPITAAQIRALHRLALTHPGDEITLDPLANPGKRGPFAVGVGEELVVLREDGLVHDSDGELLVEGFA